MTSLPTPGTSQSAPRPLTLRDFPEATLRSLLAAHETQFPAAAFRKQEELAGDNIQMRMAFHAGQQSVVDAVRVALRLKADDAARLKPREDKQANG